MSIFTASFVQLQQAFRRIHDDPLRPEIDHHDARRHRDHHLAALPLDDQVAALHRPFDGGDAADEAVARIPHLAADQIVPVERVLRQRLDIGSRHPQFRAGEPLRVVHRLDAFERDDRTPLLKPHFADTPGRGRLLRTDEQQLPRPEAPLREVGLEIDDHLPAVSVRPGHATDEEKFVSHSPTP